MLCGRSLLSICKTVLDVWYGPSRWQERRLHSRPKSIAVRGNTCKISESLSRGIFDVSSPVISTGRQRPLKWIEYSISAALAAQILRIRKIP